MFKLKMYVPRLFKIIGYNNYNNNIVSSTMNMTRSITTNRSINILTSSENSTKNHNHINNDYIDIIIENERKYMIAQSSPQSQSQSQSQSSSSITSLKSPQKLENKDENKYLDLIRYTLENGELVKGRNGNVLSVFGYQMSFDLRENTFPLLTTKKMAWKTCIKELLWFLRGDTDNNTLKAEGVHIWDGNSTRDFLDSRGLYTNREGDLGAIYGFQWRNFNGHYLGADISKSERNRGGIDQIKYVIDALTSCPKEDNMCSYSQNYSLPSIPSISSLTSHCSTEKSKNYNENKYSRRLIVSAWNPQQLHMMALPPCHVLFQFHVNQRDELSCSLYQRSGDIGLGVPFNIASYSALTILLAKHCGLKPGKFVHNLGDAHIYESHIPELERQIQREPYKSPKLYLKQVYNNIEDYKITDFELKNYKYYPKINMNMIS
jgi:thymidylate synthase